jgi:hypothetical protein
MSLFSQFSNVSLSPVAIFSPYRFILSLKTTSKSPPPENTLNAGTGSTILPPHALASKSIVCNEYVQSPSKASTDTISAMEPSGSVISPSLLSWDSSVNKLLPSLSRT